MEPLYVEPSKTIPEIRLEAGMPLEITGRSIPEDPDEVYAPVMDWLEAFFTEKPTAQTILEFRLEYLNSGSSKYILEILKRLKEYHDEGFPVLIKWFYEEEDEAILELGEHYRETTKLPFELIPVYG
ncbi:MAG: DUF1987 domain-containing protein [Chlorobi bacterium]|nr:DUF1987 domain-containing protein [Chlorobiota bacterium]